ncbi:MAG: SHOCT domain-containing protein [Chloroflexota bacterium]|nr:MAG: SHOCT domain-containing protein [Chloroflexota bacterium]
MGPMGRMWQGGPMMGGDPGVTVAGPDPWSIALLVLLIALLVFTLWWRFERRAHHRGAPGDALRERYARGEIDARQYRDALMAVLKDRYVRGEIELDEFEEKVARLVSRRPLPSNTAATSPAGRVDNEGTLEDQPVATTRGGI